MRVSDIINPNRRKLSHNEEAYSQDAILETASCEQELGGTGVAAADDRQRDWKVQIGAGMSSEICHVERCFFCDSTALRQTHAGLYHTVKPDHGPFAFHRCTACGSGLTLSPPSRDQLTALYGFYQDGLPELYRTITRDDPQSALYRLAVKRLMRLANPLPTSTWLDVGAGGGELSLILADVFPRGRGTGIDLHDRPVILAGHERINWLRVDINHDEYAAEVGGGADVVMSTAVWEHVLYPDRFVRNLLRLVNPGGALYLLCPDYGSLARRVMGRRWPYFVPGEHLNMPTPAGALACLARVWRELHGAGPLPVIHCRPLALPYTFRYVLRRFGWDGIGRLLPSQLGIPLPVGALEIVLLSPRD